MPMKWEELTAVEFRHAVEETGVCIIGVGVVEKHGDHLPLGTDFINSHAIVSRAAEKEKAVVFPPFYFGQIYEARCHPGTITLKPTLLLEVLLGVLDEIGRNGFKKVIIYNGHGGNQHLLPFITQCQNWEKKTYSVYLMLDRMTPERRREWEKISEEYERSMRGGHAGEYETSMTLANFQDLVKPERMPDEPVLPLGRLSHLPPTMAGLAWYGDFPEHVAGNARFGSVEKGRKVRQFYIDTVAEYIKAVKEDTVLPALEAEFFERESALRQRRRENEASAPV